MMEPTDDTQPNATSSGQPQISPFLDPGLKTTPGALAIVQLARDNFLPVYLKAPTGAVDGYAEGAVINTRFGSFPHSTLLDVPWGSQIRASTVDTGSRGRKRKAGDMSSVPEEALDNNSSTPLPADSEGGPVKEAVTANSGFVHVLCPTPELWTSSLPHRTQVVYTPDYSYILHRIRARPGTVLLEAGAGSGSFSHASARAVYNGYPAKDDEPKDVTSVEGEVKKPRLSNPVKRRNGKVYSFEFNEKRYHQMKKEITDHKLDEIVQLTHRDVYGGGFLVNDGESPGADAVFLDLPSPWDAIPHLSRSRPASLPLEDEENGSDAKEWTSPLNPNKTVHICTFSPCIEQVTQTIDSLRKHGWTEIDMIEMSHKRINVVREKIGLSANDKGGEKGQMVTSKDVMEAVERLKGVEAKAREYHAATGVKSKNGTAGEADDMEMDIDDHDGAFDDDGENDDDDEKEVPWLQGRLIHRTESEIKTHTSYLTFAVLPREWSEDQEDEASKEWSVGGETVVIGHLGREAMKEQKRKLLQGKPGGKKRGGKKGKASA